MRVRFYHDPETGLPHLFDHGVTPEEVREVLERRGEISPGERNTRRKLGKTAAGRYLQVIYVADAIPDSVFVITAYELKGKAKIAFRRRQRRKPR